MTDWIVPIRHSLRWKLASTTVSFLVGCTAKFWAKILTNVNLHNKEEILKHVYNREEGRPLITISNHDSCADDPIAFGSIFPLSWFANTTSRRFKWTLGAREVCFSQPSHSLFFRLGRVLPIVRGEGVYQSTMNEVLKELDKGDWLHIYPEGKINLEKEFIRLKWGVARLIADAQVTPIVLPYWHYGMEHILPNTPPYKPRINKKVTIVVGKPMYFDDMVQRLKAEKKNCN